jgi:peptide/nickel transport system substrate-binding protein
MLQGIRCSWSRALALLTAVALLGALACGGDEEDAPAAPAAAAPTAAPAATAAAAVATAKAPVATAAAVATKAPVASAAAAGVEGAKRPVLAGISKAEMVGAKYGGTLRVILYRAMPNLSPTQTAPDGEETMQGMYSKMLTWDRFNPQESVPDLATSWSVNDTGDVFTFKLRDDVKWHDGVPFTAADVKATYDYSTKLWSEFGQGRRWGGFVDDVYESSRVVDDHTIEVTLKFPFADFIGLISSSQLRIAPKHKIDDFIDLPEFTPMFTGDELPPVGTGPFKYKSWTQGVGSESVRYDDYHNTYEGKELPFLDGYQGTVLVDKAVQLAAFAANRIDVWPVFPTLSTDEKDRLVEQNGDKIRVIGGTTILNMYTAFNMEKFPTNDPKFRKAIQLITDLDDLNDRVYQGHFNPGFVIDPAAFPKDVLPEAEMKTSDWFLPKDKAHAMAKELLAEIGFATPADVPEMNLIAQSSAPFKQSAEVKGAQLNAFGIKNTVQILPPSVTFANSREGKFDLWDMGTGTTILTPINIIQQNYLSEKAHQWIRWDDPVTGELSDGQVRMRALYDKNVAELDPAKRREILFDMQRILYFEDFARAPSGFPGAWVVVWSYVKGHFAGAGLYEGQQRLYTWIDK